MPINHGRPTSKTNVVTGAPREDRELAVYDLLDKLNVEYDQIDHLPANTMEACLDVEKNLGVSICKNLFLTNRQQTDFYLLLTPGDKVFKTKFLSKELGIARLSFANADQMMQYLNVVPGAVTVFGLMNDKEQKVQLVIDEDVLTDEYLGAHPCVYTACTKIKTKDLLKKIIPAMKHEAKIIHLETD